MLHICNRTCSVNSERNHIEVVGDSDSDNLHKMFPFYPILAGCDVDVGCVIVDCRK